MSSNKVIGIKIVAGKSERQFLISDYGSEAGYSMAWTRHTRQLERDGIPFTADPIMEE